MRSATLRTAALTALALCAFAANSLLCRLALARAADGGAAAIDPVSFTTLRLASGALLLWLLVRGRGTAGAAATHGGGWLPALLLFAYAIAFSVAYTAMGAAPGALVLFGSVQLTMLLAALVQGERPGMLRWAGMAAAMAGVLWLLLPGVHAPPLAAALAMAAAGMAWGGYSLLGRHTTDPLQATASNFVRATPLALVALLCLLPSAHVGGYGAALAVASGALASGLGYVAWYAALRGLSAHLAATSQLAVPVLTAFGAVTLLGEAMTTRLAIAGVLVLGGIGLASRWPSRPARAE